MGKGGKITIGYQYYMGMHQVICCSSDEAPVDEVSKLIVDQREAWVGSVTSNTRIHINKPDLFGGKKKEGGIVGDVDLMFGRVSQGANDYLEKVISSSSGVSIPAVGSIIPVQQRSNDAPWNNSSSTNPTPIEGYTMLVGPAGKGVFAGHSNDFAVWNGGANQWIFTDPVRGNQARIGNTDIPSVFDGETWQVSKMPVPAFRGVLSAVLRQVYLCSMSPYPKQWMWKVKRIPARAWYNAKAEINGAANPAHIIYETLTNTDWGLGYPSSQVDTTTFTAAADTLYSESFGLNFLLNSSDSVENFLYDVLDHIGAAFYCRPDDGRFAIRLLRNDYDAATVIANYKFDETNVTKLESFERPTYAEMVNEVIVTFRPQGALEDDSVTLHDLASIQAQEGVVSQTINYPGIPSASLANRAAMRELRMRSTPFAKLKIKVNRKAWNLSVGSVFAFSWAEHNIANLICRVMSIDFGDLTAQDISIEAAEDVFGLPNTSYLGEQQNGWVDPIQAPAPADLRWIYEAPYWDIARNMTAADLSYRTNSSAYLLSAVGAVPYAALGYELWTNAGAGYVKAGQEEFCPVAQLAAPIGYVDTAISLKNIKGNFDNFTIGGYARIANPAGDELVRVDTINVDLGTLNIGRGVLDTVPRSHPVNTYIYFADGFQAFDTEEYTPNETVYAKVLPQTGSATLPLGSAQQDALLMVGRFGKPYVPGNVRWNSLYYPTRFTDALTINWSRRNRLQQLATLNDYTTGDIAPEAGTTYDLFFYGEDGLLKKSYTGLATTSQTWDTELIDTNIFNGAERWFDSAFNSNFYSNNFETGALGPEWSGAVWSIQTVLPHSGTRSLRSPPIGDSASTSTVLSLKGPGLLTFWYIVSSESGYDWLRIFIDGVQVVATTGTNNVYQLFQQQITGEGNHTVTFTYAKDSSQGHGYDSGFIDDIQFFPPGTETSKRLNGTIRTVLNSRREGLASYQSYDYTSYRGGYGSNYGRFYGS